MTGLKPEFLPELFRAATTSAEEIVLYLQKGDDPRLAEYLHPDSSREMEVALLPYQSFLAEKGIPHKSSPELAAASNLFTDRWRDIADAAGHFLSTVDRHALSTAVKSATDALVDALADKVDATANNRIYSDLTDCLRHTSAAAAHGMGKGNPVLVKLDNMERNDKNRFEWIKKRFEWLTKIIGFLVPWLSPDNMFDGIEEAGSEMKQEQLRAAILFCHDKATGYPIARIGSKSKNRGKKTIADLARDVWAANPSWENHNVFPDGYASEKSFENGLREQAKRNLKSFVWLKD